MPMPAFAPVLREAEPSGDGDGELVGWVVDGDENAVGLAVCTGLVDGDGCTVAAAVDAAGGAEVEEVEELELASCIWNMGEESGDWKSVPLTMIIWKMRVLVRPKPPGSTVQGKLVGASSEFAVTCQERCQRR